MSDKYRDIKGRPSIHPNRNQNNDTNSDKMDVPKTRSRSRSLSNNRSPPKYSMEKGEATELYISAQDVSSNSEINSETDSELNKEPVNLPEVASPSNFHPNSIVTNSSTPLTGSLLKNKTLSKQSTASSYCNWNCIIVSTFITFAIVAVVVGNTYNETENVTLKEISAKFELQNDDLWRYFNSGVNEVNQFEKPCTFILLYESQNDATVNKMAAELAQYAICQLKSCEKLPIILSDRDINTQEIIDDYGVFIENYKPALMENSVMLVRNLENVQGASAQAFHSFCDSVTPIYGKSLFIFTMKVEKLPQEKDLFHFVDNYFSIKWSDIKVDAYKALITRLGSLIIEIKPIKTT